MTGRDRSSGVPLACTILDPTGNITALIEGECPEEEHLRIAGQIMKAHPEVEQAGFISPGEKNPETGRNKGCDLTLRMAGGEFCGNASMSAAALFLMRKMKTGFTEETVFLRVSGAARPVEVRLKRTGADSFDAGVHMPPALSVGEKTLEWQGIRERLSMVRMEGISHLIIPENSRFAALAGAEEDAGGAVKKWCRETGADGLGLMFLRRTASGMSLTPLVYVPAGDTLFWENSCASGTAAAGIFLAGQDGTETPAGQDGTERIFREPGGSLRTVTRRDGDTWLYGRVRVRETFTL